MSAPELTQYQQGISTIGADGLNTFVQSCDTFATLRGFTPAGFGTVIAQGSGAAGDGNGGIFWWNGSLVSPVDNNTTVIVPYGAVQGAWVRLLTFS